MLGKRRFPLERAAAQVCREAGARVAMRVFARDMDLATFNALDSREERNWQWALQSKPRAANYDGAALEAARRKKETTNPGLAGEGRRVRLVVLAAEVVGRWNVETAQFLTALARARAQEVPLLGSNGGAPSSPALLHVSSCVFAGQPPCCWHRGASPFGPEGIREADFSEQIHKVRVRFVKFIDVSSFHSVPKKRSIFIFFFSCFFFHFLDSISDFFGPRFRYVLLTFSWKKCGALLRECPFGLSFPFFPRFFFVFCFFLFSFFTQLCPGCTGGWENGQKQAWGKSE